MKRILSIVLCALLLLGCAVPCVFAETVKREAKVWYTADFDDGTPGIAQRRTDGGWDVSFSYVDDDKGGQAVYIERGKNVANASEYYYCGLKIDLSAMLSGTDIQSGEGYSVGFRAKAAPGETIYVMPEFYGVNPVPEEHKAHLYVDGQKVLFEVTGDKWTEVQLGDYFFAGDIYKGTTFGNAATEGFLTFITCSDPEGRTQTHDDLYLDDIQVSAPTDTVIPDATPFTETFEAQPLGPCGESEIASVENEAAQQSPAGGNYVHIQPAGATRLYYHNVNAAVRAQGAGNYTLQYWARADKNVTLYALETVSSTYRYQAITTEWTLYSAAFTVSEDELTKTVNILFATESSDCPDVYLDSISFDREPGELELLPEGDVNLNGAVDVCDLVRLDGILRRLDGYTETVKADVNRSGAADEADFTGLRDFLLQKATLPAAREVGDANFNPAPISRALRF